MASYLDALTGYGGRSYNSLVISEGNMPAEAFIPASEEDVKFEFVFGPEANQGVVIPKGKILAAGPLEYDPLTETMRPTVKIARGNPNEYPIGVAPYNVYETRFMVDSENNVSPLTRSFIQVPLFAGENAADAAANIGFGAAVHSTEDLTGFIGQYVKADTNGNFVKADPATDYPYIVGQVLAVENNTPPAGFLQYCLEMDTPSYNEFIKKTREVLGIANAANNRQANNAFADMAKFAAGLGYPTKGSFAHDYLTQIRGGIRFLTDGYFSSRVNKTLTYGSVTVDEGVISETIKKENIRFTDESGFKWDGDTLKYVAANVDHTASVIGIQLDKTTQLIDTLGSTVASGTTAMVHLMKDANGNSIDPANLPELGLGSETVQPIVVKVGGNTVNPKRVKVDLYNNVVYVYVDKSTTDIDNVSLEIKLDVVSKENFGLPTIRDFKGCVGVAKILLLK